MSKLLKHGTTIYFRCPGCKTSHAVGIGPGGWGFNGNDDSPTFTPSVLVNGDLSCPGAPRCHSFVTDGQIQFLGDCTHEMANRTVPLPEYHLGDE